jgi:signal transduction histidine kinase
MPDRAHQQSGSQDYCQAIARRIQNDNRVLSARWLDELKALLPVSANDVFPSDALLDHIPSLLHELAAYLCAPAEEEIGANTSVIAKARQLGELRHEQQASVHQLLREYELLGTILEGFIAGETERLALCPSAAECITLTSRLSRALQSLMQMTVDTFIARYTQTIAEQTQKLESYNRMVSHELRNPLGTLAFTLSLLAQEQVVNDPAARGQVLELMQRNCDRMRDLLRNLEHLTRAGTMPDTPSVQQVEIRAIAAEVERQLHDMAAAREVEIRVAPGLPSARIDPARLELILMNLVSNGIKYSDPAKRERFVEISGGAASGENRITLCVRDNGLGIPQAAMPSLFKRFFRAHVARDKELGIEGTGLGLSIAQECIDLPAAGENSPAHK